VAIVHVVGSTDKLEYPKDHVLYQTQGYLSDLRVSPDGWRVAFMEHPVKWDDRGYVKIVDRDGGPPTTLAGDFWGEQGLAWSRDGTTVYFSATTVAMGDYLPWAVSSSGRRAPRQVLSGAGSLYVQDIAGADGHGQWLVTRHDWSQSIRALIPGATEEREFSWGNNVSGPTLSRDGKTLLFMDSNPEAGWNYRIGVRATDGSPAVSLGKGSPWGFSPDERWVLASVFSPPGLVRYPIGVGASVPVDHGSLERVGSAGWIDDTHVWICGNEKGRAARCYLQNIAGGPLKTLTPEGLDVALVSPDGKFIAVSSGTLDSATRIMPFTGGDPRPVPGLLAGDLVFAWTRDSKALLVQTADLPAQLDRLDPAAGTRTHIRSIAHPDRAGGLNLRVNSVLEDGRFYAYGYRRELATLYVVTGCRWETMSAPCR
jgi:Tol biopolymer transport system component